MTDGYPKRKRGRLKKEKTAEPVQRVTTFKPNGGTSMHIAPEPAGVDLGPVVLPEPEQAVQVLRVLAEWNDRTIQAHERYVEQQTKAKAAKGKWEELAAELQKKLRAATHGSDLPLFDVDQREQDLKAMETAAEDARKTLEATFPAEPAKEARSDSSASDIF